MQYQPIDRHESKVLELRRERRTEAEKLEALKKALRIKVEAYPAKQKKNVSAA
jgi:hypothetical protein